MILPVPLLKVIRFLKLVGWQVGAFVVDGVRVYLQEDSSSYVES